MQEKLLNTSSLAEVVLKVTFKQVAELILIILTVDSLSRSLVAALLFFTVRRVR